TITSVTLQALSNATTLYYKTSTVNNTLAIRADYTPLFAGGSNQAWQYLGSIATAPSFSGLSVDNGTPVSGQTSLTFSPDGSSANNFVYIRFTPSDASLGWHVAISSCGFVTNVFEAWNSGNPNSTVFWDGHDRSQGNTAAGGIIAPNATYT